MGCSCRLLKNAASRQSLGRGAHAYEWCVFRRSSIQGFLKQDLMEDMTRWMPIFGSPQGAVVSPLLANAYLHEPDVEMHEAGLVMVRYADDAVVLCRSRAEAEAALACMRAWVSANGWTLHPDKTHIGDCRVAGQGHCFNDHRQWQNSFFADLGLFTMCVAHQLVRQSRYGNN
jgi:retron-type reverse transcriptase